MGAAVALSDPGGYKACGYYVQDVKGLWMAGTGACVWCGLVERLAFTVLGLVVGWVGLGCVGGL